MGETIGESALIATRKLLPLIDLAGISFAHRFSPKRKMSKT
jgi:hypothetical protein